jgi:hypothetical protein
MKAILFLAIVLLSIPAFCQHKDYRWNYMKNDDRLVLLKNNVTRTGIVQKVYSEVDGDIHIYLKVAGDSVRKDSTVLIVEMICVKQTTQCKDYINSLPKPKKGQKIRVMGDWVFDSKHKWYEIHPVKTLVIIK